LTYGTNGEVERVKQKLDSSDEENSEDSKLKKVEEQDTFVKKKKVN